MEYFTILLYGRIATWASINDVRKLFTRKGREMSTLPPYKCKAALQQHIRRAVLQGGHYRVVQVATMPGPDRRLPSPADWGWTCPGQWMRLWTKLQEACVSCPELLRRRCRTRCACTRAHLKYTVYCTCRRDCDSVNLWHLRLFEVRLSLLNRIYRHT